MNPSDPRRPRSVIASQVRADERCAAHALITIALIAAVLGGCVSSAADKSPSVGDAWRQSGATPEEPAGHTTHPSEARNDSERASNSVSDVIASVNGRPIRRHELIDLMFRSHGAGMLEQLVMLRAAEQRAADLGLHISESEVDREFERALRRLTNPEFAASGTTFDSQAAERTLDSVLSERNISREEFLIGIRHRAHLRVVVEHEQQITESQLREEFKRSFGPRLRVRHIQLASMREVDRIQEHLADGESFESLARRYSANLQTAEADGLLDPLSLEDDTLPRIFRERAAALSLGEISPAVRVGEWYHLIKLVETIPAESVRFEDVRADLESSLKERLTEPAMQRLYDELFRDAEIAIFDPALKNAFQEAHGRGK